MDVLKDMAGVGSSVTSSTAELQTSNIFESSANLEESSKRINFSGCCSQLDEHCQMVEVRPGRNLRICHIPGSTKIDPSARKCYQETSRKNVKVGNEAPLHYSINYAADNSPEVVRKSDSKMLLQESTIKQTAIFFVHGVGGEFKVWSPQIIFFNNLGFTIVAMDLIGHGLSSAPKRYSAYHFDEISNDVLAVFDKYSMSINVLAGHSYGSSFAAFVTRSRSSLIHSLILISGGGPYPLGPELGIFCLPLCILGCLKPCIFRGFLSRSFKRPNRSNKCQKAAVSCPMHVLKKILRGQKWDDGGVEYYSWIACPTLLVHGRRDQLIPCSDALFMECTIHASELVILENTGHTVMLDSPEETNSTIWSFLSKRLSNYKSASRANLQLKEKLSSTESTV